MIVPLTQALATRFPLSSFIAVLISLGLGGFSMWLWPGFPKLVMLALWSLSLAVGFMGVAFISFRRQGEALWGLAIIGQLFGVVGTALLFITSLVQRS